MGAGGHVYIWRTEKVRAVWPDADALFACLPTHYRDELDGVEYDHCYVGDNLYCAYTDKSDWYRSRAHYRSGRSIPYTADEVIEAERVESILPAFVEWLEAHATHWEVWT